jgi:tetratricopeptide (TPR) repeat protein
MPDVEVRDPRPRETGGASSANGGGVDLHRALDEEGILDDEAFAAVEADLVQGERWTDLAALYGLGAERAPDGERGLRMLLSAGLLWLEQLGDPRKAESHLRRVLAIDPTSADALFGLLAICEGAGRFDEAVELLDRCIGIAEDSAKPDLLVRLAEIAHQKLRQVDRALGALRLAYELDPNRLDVLERARHIFIGEERWADAKRVLDDEARAVLGELPALTASAPMAMAARLPEAQQIGDVSFVPMNTADLMPVAPEAVKTDDVAVAVPAGDEARSIAEAYRQLGVHLLGHATQHEVAEECLARARQLGDEEALSKLDELAHLRKDWEARATAYRDEGFEARDKRKAAQLYLRAAELYYQYGKDPIRAEEYLDRCLILSPGYAPAIRFIETTRQDPSKRQDLIKKLNAISTGVKDPGVKVDILLRVAQLLEAEAGEGGPSADLDAVVNAYRRALAIQPGHRETVSLLGHLLAGADRHADRAQILEAQLAAESDEYTKSTINEELGRTYAELLGDSERARAHFEAVLAVNPTDFGAASALRALYKDAHEQPLLLGVLKVLVEYTPDLFSRLEMLTQMMEVAREVSREEELAISRQIFEIDPKAKGVRERLEVLAEELGRYKQLADTLMATADRKRGVSSAELYAAAGRIYDEKLPRPADAIRAYRKALEVEPSNSEIHDALERLLQQSDDPAALVEILKSQLARNEDPEKEPILMAKLADVLDQRLGDLAAAIAMFGKVLERSPGNATALSSLDDLYRRTEDHERQAQILTRREAITSDPDELADLMVRRARLYDERIGKPDVAIDVYLEVLERHPDRSEVIDALARLAPKSDGPAALRIASALEPIYATRGQGAKQLEMLDLVLAYAEEPRRRAAAQKAAHVAEHRMSSASMALRYACTLLTLDPRSEEARDGVLRLAAHTGELPIAARTLESILATADLPRDTVSQLATALGDAYDAGIGDKAKAIEQYQRAVHADGSNAAAIAALERLLGAESRWKELASLLEERIERSDDKAAKVQLGLSVAAMKEGPLGDAEGAVRAYKDVLALEPKESTALAKLAEVLDRQGRWRDLIGILDRMRSATDDSEVAAAIDVRAGDVLRTELTEPKDAVARYARALETNPISEGAIAGLETLGSLPEHTLAIGVLLAPSYERLGRFRDLCRALEAQLGSEGSKEKRKELTFRIAAIHEERLDQAGAAFDLLAAAMREGIIGRAERGRLAALALSANRARALAELYEDLLPKEKDVDLHRELARLYDGAAADPTRAERAYKRVLEHNPKDAEALEALERLTASGDDPNALAEVLLERADAASSAAERVAFSKRASAIYEEALEDLAKAIGAMERARAYDESDRTTWQELQRLHGMAGDREAVRAALVAEARLVEEPLQRAGILLKLAELSTALDDADSAIAAYSKALEAVPAHQVAREGLERMMLGTAGAKAAAALEPVYRAAGDWSHLVEAYEILASASEDRAERIERLVAIRSIYEERLGRLDKAFQAAARAYKEAPENEELLATLEHLGKVSGQTDELLGILEDQAEALPYVSEERHAVRIRIARTTEHLFPERSRIIGAWKAVLEERPDSLIALDALEALYRKTGEARELVEVLRAMAGAVEDRREQMQKLRQAAQILDEKLGDRAGAARIYEQVVMLDPKDREALSRLHGIYERARAHAELARVIEIEIRATEGAERASFELRLGQLRRTVLQDPRGALEAYAEVLAKGTVAGVAYEGAVRAVDELIGGLKGSHPELVAHAAGLIEPHWIEMGQPLKVVAAKEARIFSATDPRARKRLLLEIGQLYETELEQPEMAFLALTRAYGETPNDAELAQELERLATAADTEEELADLYAQVLPSIEEPDMALRLARRTAHIYDTVLGRGDAAVPYYNKILGLSPDDASALTALERVHRRAGDAAALVEVYRGMLRLAGEPAERKGLFAQIASLLESDLEDPDGAFEAYREILAIDPEDAGVVKRMTALSERSGRYEDVATLYVKQAALAESVDEKAQVYLKLATLAKERLDDPQTSVDAYAKVLEVRPKDKGAIAGLASLVRVPGPARAEAAQVLGPIYLSSGAFDEYIGCLQARVEGSATSMERKALFSEIADVLEQRLGRPEHAFTYACRALHEDLSDEAVRGQAERLAKENSSDEELAGFYLDEVDAVTDHDLAVHLRRRVAEIYDQSLRDTPRAIAEYNKILDVAPGDPESLRALERLYKAAGSFGSLADVYRRRIAQAEDDGARLRLMREFARLQGDELADAPGAISTLRKMLEIEPKDVDALARLAKLCKQQGRATELSDVLERLIDAATPGAPELLQAKVELGKLKATRLGDVAGADKLLEEVLEVEPTYAEARDFLQERFEDAAAEENGALVEQAGEVLAKAMRSAGEWAELITVLRMRAELAPAHDRVPLNREIAEVYRAKLNQPDLAFTTLAQVFREAPGLDDVRASLEQLAESLLYYEELVDVFEASLPKVHDGEIAGILERRIASLTEQKLGDRERAADAWKRVLDRRPNDVEALVALDRLDQTLGRWAAQADVLEKRIGVEADPKVKHELMVRLAALWDERLSEKDEAIAWYRQARQLVPDHRDTLLSLSLLLDPEAHAEELYGVLEGLSLHHGAGRERTRIFARMAELAGGALGIASRGIDLYKAILETEPQNAPAKKGLEELLEKEARWQELANLLEQQLEQARDEKEMMRVQRKLALVKGTRLGSIDEAVRSWSEILKRNPNDVEALSALRQIYREAGRWDELVATMRKLIPLQPKAEGVKEIRFELAEVFLSKLDQREEAIESAKRVLDVEPHTSAELMRLEEIFVQTGAFGDAVKVMNERVDVAETAGEKVDILFEVARIYEEKIHRKAGASAAYEKVLALDPASGKAYDALAAIYEQNGDYRKLVELINRRLETTEQADQRKKLLFAIIEIQESRLGHPELAFTAACRAFGEEGADEHAREIAERLADETDNWEILAEVYLEQVDNVGVARAIEIRKRLGQIYVEKLDEAEEAERQLETVLSLRPDDEEARELLLGILEKQERWNDLISHLNDKVEVAPVEERKRIFRRISVIQETRAGDVEGAISSIKRILDLEPEDGAALDDLVRIFRGTEKWHPLLNVLHRKLELAESAEAKLEARLEIAVVWEQGIEDLDQAVESYKDILIVDDRHRQALSALERLYTLLERWSDLIEIYERQVQLAGDASEAIVILSRIASIWEEQYRDLSRASDTLIRVLEIDPEHLPTVRQLERIWRESEDWERLIEAIYRHIELSKDTPEIVELYRELGQIQMDRLDRPDEAEASFTQALDADPSAREVVHALGHLHEQQGNWFNALEMLKREADLIGAQQEAVELCYRMGKINEEMLMELPAAAESYARALDIDPSYTPAIRAQRILFEKDQNWNEVIALTAQEAEYTADPRERAQLYQEAADGALGRFEDVDQAIRYYEKSIEADADHVPSLRALADLYFSDEKWDGAEGLLERLVTHLDANDGKDELCRQFYRLAYISEKLGDDQLALERYLSSYEHDATYLPTLEGLAAALLRAERWEDAQRILQTILIQHKSSLTDAEVVDLYFQLGELAAKLDQLERATKSFKKALDLDPDHAPTLRAYSELAEKQEQWEEAYEARERLIALVDIDERFDHLVRQANLCRDKIKEPYRAIDAYSEAKRIRPDDVRVLRALVRLYQETSQAPRTIEVLNDLVAVLENPTEKRDTYMDLARAWAEQQNIERAIQSLNAALDTDPMYLTAFQRIEQILFEAKAWHALEQNYHAMIKRMPKDQKKGRAVLWRSLGDLYQKVLKNTDGARTAFEVVLKLEPNTPDVGLSLAGIYAQKRESAPQALSLYHQLLETSDDPAVPARKLFELYHALGQLDRVFCSLGALILMRAANETELQAYQMLLKKAPPAPTRSLTDNLWRKHVLHPACRTSLADIASIVYRGAPDVFMEGQRALQLKKKEKVDLEEKGKNARVRLRYFDIWARLQGAMHVGDMEHWHRPGSVQAPRLYPGLPAILFAGEQHEAFKTMNPRQIAWTIARQMATARPEIAAVRALAPDEVGAMIEAAIQIFSPEGSGVDLALDQRLVQGWKKALSRHLAERAVRALREPVVQCLEKREMRHLARFLEGAEHTASRAAILMAQDVAAAERGLGESDQLVDVSFRARVRALMLFTLSEDHFALREKLGLAVGSGPPQA